jgi:hypothetical protein
MKAQKSEIVNVTISRDPDRVSKQHFFFEAKTVGEIPTAHFQLIKEITNGNL